MAGTLAALAQAQPEPSGTWLDDTTNWNQAGQELPAVPVIAGGGNLSDCLASARQAALPEDVLVEAAGWTLTGAAQLYGSTTVITAMANADGMCRPLSYQTFVFTEGAFAGTLSPIPMDSRTDGSLVNVSLYRDGYMSAFFNRYTPEDPLCCASGESVLFYEVEMQDGSPVVIPHLPASTSSPPGS
jgi:hypothetical protein